MFQWEEVGDECVDSGDQPERSISTRESGIESSDRGSCADPLLSESGVPLSGGGVRLCRRLGDLAEPRRWLDLGMLFLLVLGMNVVIIAFEFPRTTSLTMLFLAVAAVLGAILLNQRFVIFPFLERQTRQLDPAANAQFYWLTAIGLTVILFTVWFVHRWVDYWEVLSNELIHHHGVLGNIERLPAPGIKLEKEITDVFEFLCLGAGRLVITVPNEGRAIVLENVPRINRVEHDIKEVLGVTEVEINQG